MNTHFPSPLTGLIILCLLASCGQPSAQEAARIDRQALVRRHTVVVKKIDPLSSLSVGNGAFAFTVDVTGLQTFPDLYTEGVPLGTQSSWGWHSFPNTEKFRFEEILKEYDYHGRKVAYDVQWKEPSRLAQASDYLRRNPHRLHLGIIGLAMFHASGAPVLPEEIKDIHQELDMWTGEITSHFSVEDMPVEVRTFCHPEKDMIAAEIRSPMVAKGLLKVKWAFPYPTGAHSDNASDWSVAEKHQSFLIPEGENSANILRTLDSTSYIARVAWEGNAAIDESGAHTFLLSPESDTDRFSFSCMFSPEGAPNTLPSLEETAQNSQASWKAFWENGGVVDFTGTADSAAAELERRVVLSQYLTAIQCAGPYPPQETGLTYNSWYGKFHLEMHAWHGVHFALWNRTHLMEKSMDWYSTVAEIARHTARRQGFAGLRWSKMTDPSGRDSPSSVGAFLIWQQPHYIYLAELCYQNQPSQETLEKYAPFVFETAEFMASYAWYDSVKNRYVLGPALIAAQERLPAETTMNPPFELAYWHWGLTTAQKWRERMSIPREENWDQVIKKLSGMASRGGLYLAAETAEDTWTNPRYMGDHPMVLGAFGMLPGLPNLDTAMMRSTFLHVWDNWQWEHTWGWDYPMVAMTATRLGMPEKAVDALLMKQQKNTFLPNGHNYQDQRLRIYLPGNGSLLTAVAMMCAGYEGANTDNPGFPKDWVVRWEDIDPLP
ncbi:MAG: hypothetical protein R3C61_19350 [Bacteroidia bacterium]